MSTTLYPTAAPVKSAPSSVPTVASDALTDRLTLAVDDAPTGPSLKDDMADSGYTIGLTGARVGVRDAFPQYSDDAIRIGGLAFTIAVNAGLREHAKRVGFDLGCDDKPCERPATVALGLDKFFAAGWEAGQRERADREREMAAYFQELDWDHAYEQEMRDAEAFNREMFYGRCPYVAMD